MIVITGATGKVGGKIAEILINAGNKCRLISRQASSLKSLGDKGAELYSCDLTNKESLIQVFNGASVVFSIIPGDFQSADIGKHQDIEGLNTIEAIKANGIKKVVFLSSVGGHSQEKSGIVAGLARQEIRLKELSGVDICILRPTYFMENLYNNLHMIITNGINGSAILPDKAFPLIHTSDIAKVAAEKLSKPDFKGISIQPLLGPRNYTMKEFTQVIGKAIGKPDLPYVHFSYDEVTNAMVQMGLSKSISRAFAELAEGINLGLFDYEKRTPDSTTPTTIEDFAVQFAQAYKIEVKTVSV